MQYTRDGYERVQKKLPNGKTTTYLGELAEVDETGAYTDYLFLGDRRVATVQGGAIYYNVSDHLGSASLELDGCGAVVQKLDYLPFGGERVNVKTAGFDTHFTFTDQEKDAESGLLYYGARYYHPVIGRFTQPDLVAIANINRREFQLALANPQLLNAYSYVGNNPIKNVDQDGEWLDTVIDAAFIAYDLYKVGQAVANGGNVGAELKALGLDVAGAALPGVTGLGMMARVANKADDVVDAVKAVDKAKDALKAGDKASDASKALKAGEKASDAKVIIKNTKTPVKTGTGKAPKKNEPNSIYEQANNKGKVDSRTYYDENGYPSYRQDYTGRAHGDVPTPHEHSFQFNKQGQRIDKRQPPKPLPPGYPNKPTKP